MREMGVYSTVSCTGLSNFKDRENRGSIIVHGVRTHLSKEKIRSEFHYHETRKSKEDLETFDECQNVTLILFDNKTTSMLVEYTSKYRNLNVLTCSCTMKICVLCK